MYSCCVFRLAGSYEALSGGLAAEAMTDMSGGVCERYNFKNELPHNMFQIMLKARERNSLIGCSIDVSVTDFRYIFFHTMGLDFILK